MRFGLFSNGTRHSTLAAATYEEDLQEIVAADAAGFELAWISEHQGLRPDVVSTTDVFIGKAAALTKQIKLGPAVRILAALHPMDVASSSAVADHLTGGRYMLGIGAGTEFKLLMDAHGVNHSDRRERMLECIDLVIRAWTATEPFDYEGRFWHGTNTVVNPKPFQKPHPPIGFATDQEDMIRVCAERGWDLLAAQYDGPDSIKTKGDQLAQAYRDLDRPVHRKRYAVARVVHVAPTDAEAYDNMRQCVEDEYAYQLTIAPGGMQFFQRKNPRMKGTTLEELIEAGSHMVGSPETVYRQLKAFYDEVGGFGTLLTVVGKDWSTLAKRAQSMELFMREVAPRLAPLDPDAEEQAAAQAQPALAATPS